MARRRQKSFFGELEPEPKRKRLPKAAPPLELQAYVRPSTPKPPQLTGGVVDVRTKKVAEHRGGSRVWLEGKWLARAGFEPGNSITVLTDPATRRITIALNEAGERIVSEHRGLPVIDLSSSLIGEAVGEADEVLVETIHGQIAIKPKETSILVGERRRSRNGLEGSIFSGAGFLTLAAKQVGYTPAFGVERDEVCADVFAANHPGAALLGDIVETVLMASRGNIQLPHVDLLTAGIPCLPYARCGRGQRIESGECKDDPIMVSMAIWFAEIVKATNPYNIVIEQVEDFLNTSMFVGLKGVLILLGYHVQHAVLDANDFGLPTGRRRAVIVATTEPAPGLIDNVAKWSGLVQPTAGDILLPPQAVEGRSHVQGGWFKVRSESELENWSHELDVEDQTAPDRARPGHYLGGLWERNKFPPQFIDESTRRVRAIVSSYGKPDPSGPFVRHPTKPDTYRLLTVEEIKRLHGVPQDYTLTDHYPTDVRLLGQGVVVDVFKAVIEELPGGTPRSRRNPENFVKDAMQSMIAESQRIW